MRPNFHPVDFHSFVGVPVTTRGTHTHTHTHTRLPEERHTPPSAKPERMGETNETGEVHERFGRLKAVSGSRSWQKASS